MNPREVTQGVVGNALNALQQLKAVKAELERHQKLTEVLRRFLEETNEDLDIDDLWDAWHEFKGEAH